MQGMSGAMPVCGRRHSLFLEMLSPVSFWKFAAAQGEGMSWKNA
jgi:hypothetical protein